MLRQAAIALALALALVLAVGVVLFVAGLFSDRTTGTECSVLIQRSGSAAADRAHALRDELQAEGYDVDVTMNQHAYKVEASASAEVLSIIGIGDDDNGPELEETMTAVAAVGRPHCSARSLID